MSDADWREQVSEAPGADGDGPADDAATLAAQVEILREENRRLRAEYRRARQTHHRQTARGFVGVGLVALFGSILFPGSRTVLLALSGTGLFAGLLLRTLTPERFIAASVGERLYAAYRSTARGLITDLGLADEQIYVPVGDGARLFIPQHATLEVPDTDALTQTIIVEDDSTARGVAFEPAGNGLYRAFERDLTDTPATDPDRLATQLAETLVQGFELVDKADPAATQDSVSLAVTGSAYGELSNFDHPVVSFLAVSVAATLSTPVTVEVTPDDDGRADALVTCRWREERHPGRQPTRNAEGSTAASRDTAE